MIIKKHQNMFVTIIWRIRLDKFVDMFPITNADAAFDEMFFRYKITNYSIIYLFIYDRARNVKAS